MVPSVRIILPAIPTSHTGRHGRVARFDVCETFRASLGKSSIPLDKRLLRTRLWKTTAGEGKGCASGAFHLTGCMWHIGIDS